LLKEQNINGTRYLKAIKMKSNLIYNSGINRIITWIGQTLKLYIYINYYIIRRIGYVLKIEWAEKIWNIGLNFIFNNIFF